MVHYGTQAPAVSFIVVSTPLERPTRPLKRIPRAGLVGCLLGFDVHCRVPAGNRDTRYGIAGCSTEQCGIGFLVCPAARGKSARPASVSAEHGRIAANAGMARTGLPICVSS